MTLLSSYRSHRKYYKESKIFYLVMLLEFFIMCYLTLKQDNPINTWLNVHPIPQYIGVTIIFCVIIMIVVIFLLDFFIINKFQRRWQDKYYSK